MGATFAGRGGGFSLSVPAGRFRVFEEQFREEMAMKKWALFTKDGTWCRWSVAGVIAATAMLVPLTAVGADRVVICEEFSSTT